MNLFELFIVCLFLVFYEWFLFLETSSLATIKQIFAEYVASPSSGATIGWVIRLLPCPLVGQFPGKKERNVVSGLIETNNDIDVNQFVIDSNWSFSNNKSNNCYYFNLEEVIGDTVCICVAESIQYSSIALDMCNYLYVFQP
jgi:hypothetical protein